MKRIVFGFIALIILLAIHAIIPESADPIGAIIAIAGAYAYAKWIEKILIPEL